MTTDTPETGWQVRALKTRLGWSAGEARAAEVGEALCDLLLASENVFEDAEYHKVVANQIVVELPSDLYARHFAPLENVICEQWRERLLNQLTTANSRLGLRAYRFAGQLTLALRAEPGLAPGQIRARLRWSSESPAAEPPAWLPACLEQLPPGKSWQLRSGLVTLGREPDCDVVLDMPRVQELRLVSARHAFLQCSPGVYRLFDGSPNGLRSTNGTFVNGRPVPATGHTLQDGDLIILAALRPDAPRPDTPGVAALRFRAQCS
jgi:hypothetical protein